MKRRKKKWKKKQEKKINEKKSDGGSVLVGDVLGTVISVGRGIRREDYIAMRKSKANISQEGETLSWTRQCRCEKHI